MTPRPRPQPTHTRVFRGHEQARAPQNQRLTIPHALQPEDVEQHLARLDAQGAEPAPKTPRKPATSRKPAASREPAAGETAGKKSRTPAQIAATEKLKAANAEKRAAKAAAAAPPAEPDA